MTELVGQSYIKGLVQTLPDLPPLTIIFGKRGQGKKAVANYLTGVLEKTCVTVGTGIDEVREVIAEAFHVYAERVYLMPDVDTMSQGAKNLLLKLVEEPPQNSKFILTASKRSSIMPTLLGRALVLTLQPYSLEEKGQLASLINFKADSLVLEASETMTDLIEMSSYDQGEFFSYCGRVVEDIGQVSGANAFKIGTKFLGDKCWDVQLFMRGMQCLAKRRMLEGDRSHPYHKICRVCSSYSELFSDSKLNKQMLLDNWIIALRDLEAE